MHAAAFSPRGGVAHKTTCPRGQSIIEYVLIIAVIGLVIVFAGPGVAGAIRNQFNLIGNTVNNGTTDGVEGGVSGGGSTGADSATVQAAVAKDAKDWTLDEQKAVAEDIAKNGISSLAYAKTKAAMDAHTVWEITLANNEVMDYAIIGINHDDLADGSGKAGLTFLTVTPYITSRMNATGTNAGGWEKSELRAKMNSGEIWNLMPPEFRSKVKPVRKLTNNVGGGDANKNAAVTATTDRLFPLSNSEIVEAPYDEWLDWSWIGNEGTRYEAFNNMSENGFEDDDTLWANLWFERTSSPEADDEFLKMYSLAGSDSYITDYASNEDAVICPAFCF